MQQASRTFAGTSTLPRQQCRRELDTRHQFEARLEAFGQLNSHVHIGPQSAGLFHRTQKVLAEAPADAATWQAAKIAKRLCPLEHARRLADLDAERHGTSSHDADAAGLQ